MPTEEDFQVPVSGKYFEKVTIQTVDGPTMAIVQVSPQIVSIFAPDEKTAKEMAESVIAQWSRNKQKE